MSEWYYDDLPTEVPIATSPSWERNIKDEEGTDEDCADIYHRPKCGTCGGPNFSLEGEVCIACRICL